MAIKASLDGVIATADQYTARNPHMEVTVDASGALSELERFKERLNEVWGAFSGSLDIFGNVSVNAPGRALGGPLQARSVYEVFDTNQPELAQLGNRTLLFTGAEAGSMKPIGPSASGAMGGADYDRMAAAIVDRLVPALADRPLSVQADVYLDGDRMGQRLAPGMGRELNRIAKMRS